METDTIGNAETGLAAEPSMERGEVDRLHSGTHIPKAEVAEGGRMLSGLIATVRRGARRDTRFRVDEDRHFDLR